MSNWHHRARKSASERSVGMVSLLGECHEPERRGTDDGLATPGCLWSTCGQGRRAEDRSEDPLRHAGLALKYLWARSPCRRQVRRHPSPGRDAPRAPVGKVPMPMDLPRTQSGPRPADKCSDLTDWFRLLNVLYLRAQDNSETV